MLGDQQSNFWRVAVVEDHRLQRLRTIELFNAQDGMRVVVASETFPQFLAWLAATGPQERPHLLVLDLLVERGPSVDPDAVRRLIDSGMRVLVLSALAAPALVRAVLRAGVGGVMGKRDSESDLVAAAWAVLGRRHWVTPEVAAVIAGDANRPRLSGQEERALVLYASGLTLSAVAQALGVKPDTAKKYLDRVKSKYAAVGRPVRSKIDLNRAAVHDGFLVEQDAHTLRPRRRSSSQQSDS